MDLISGFFPSTLGTATVRTPFSMLAFTSSTLAFSGSLNLLMNCPLLRSIPMLFVVFSCCSLLLYPLICRTLPSSTLTLTSCLLIPGSSAVKMWACGVSFQSMLSVDKSRGFTSRGRNVSQ
uniref:Uncharacterized protein n=1 Tax=Cucumis melo TaxID=3656 RepID=A0A9I9EJJ8_CUCME